MQRKAKVRLEFPSAHTTEMLRLGLFLTLPKVQSWDFWAEHSNSNTEPGGG